MGRRSNPFCLEPQDKNEIHEMLRGGVQQVRVVLRALALLHLDSGMSATEAGAMVTFSEEGVRGVCRRYRQSGLESALFESPRPGHGEILTETDKQRIIAMVCSEPPVGRARWTVRLVAAEAVKRKIVPKVGRETIRILFQSHDLKPWREKNVVRVGA